MLANRVERKNNTYWYIPPRIVILSDAGCIGPDAAVRSIASVQVYSSAGIQGTHRHIHVAISAVEVLCKVDRRV